jgi:hypothetical protein
MLWVMQTLTATTWFNRITLLVLSAGIVYLFVLGQTTAAVLWLAGVLYAAFSVVRSVSGRARDTTRVDAAQPFDERDAAAVRSGFALVGQVAFIAQLAIVIWHMGRPEEPGLLVEAGKVVVLAVALGVGNRAALRQA